MQGGSIPVTRSTEKALIHKAFSYFIFVYQCRIGDFYAYMCSFFYTSMQLFFRSLH